MRPPQSLVVTAKVRTIACQDEIYHVHITIVVAVVVFKIDIGVGGIDGCVQDGGGPTGLVGGILTVIYFVRAIDIELRLELAQ